MLENAVDHSLYLKGSHECRLHAKRGAGDAEVIKADGSLCSQHVKSKDKGKRNYIKAQG